MHTNNQRVTQTKQKHTQHITPFQKTTKHNNQKQITELQKQKHTQKTNIGSAKTQTRTTQSQNKHTITITNKNI